MKRNKIKEAAQYLKNMGTSSAEIIKDLINKTELVMFVNDRLVEYDEWKEEQKGKDKSFKAVTKELTDKQVKEFWEWMDSDRFEDGSAKQDVQELKEELIQGIRTGTWKNKKDADAFADLLSEDEDYLFSDMDDFDENGFGESFRYNKLGGYMKLIEKKKELTSKLRMVAHKENLEAISPIESLNEEISKIRDAVLKNADAVDSTECNEINDVLQKPMYDSIRDDIYNTISLVATNTTIEDKYKEVLSTALATLFVSKCQYTLSKETITEKDNENLNNEANDLVISIDNMGATAVSKEVDNKITDIKAITTEEIAERIDGMGAPDEDALSVETSLVTPAGEFFSIDSGFAKLAVALVAIPVNLGNRANIEKLEAKHGANFVFRQPMIVGSDVSKEVASKYAKAIEVKQLIEIKGLIEATAAQMDGGSVVSRAAKGSKILSPLNIEMRKGAKVFADTNMSYDEIIAAFSESGLYAFKQPSNATVTAVESFARVAARNPLDFEIINNTSTLTSKGEAGDFIDHRRNALPSYMEMTIDYKTTKDDTTFTQDVKSKKTNLGLQILPRTVPSNDIAKSLVELNENFYTTITVSKEERNFLKKTINLINFWKAKGNKNETAVLKSNGFADIINRIKHVKSPLFHLVISYDTYVNMKENSKTDLMNAADYKKIMKELPLISITIIDEDSDILYLSEGETMSYIRHSVDDFIDTVAQYEKELKTILKYNQI